MKRRLLQFLFCLISLSSYSQNFEWAKAFNGELSRGCSIVVDPSENVYSAGIFADTVDFDPGSGVYNLFSTGSISSYISKLNVFGNFVWAKKISGGSDSQCEVNSIVLDAFDNIYITGKFRDTIDVNPGFGTYNLISNWDYNMFITKLDSSGNFLWAKSFGPVYDSISSAVGPSKLILDSNGNIIITGYFFGKIDFNPGIGIDSLVSVNSQSVQNNIFILKLNSNGNFIWAKRIGVTGYDAGLGRSIAVDPLGNIYSLSSLYIGLDDYIYILKMDLSGNFIWAKTISSSGSILGESMAVNYLGEVYIVGGFSGTVDFDPGSSTYYLSSPLARNIFISKLDGFGNFVWAKSIGSPINFDIGVGLTLDASGNIYTTGSFADTVDFDSGVGVYNLNASGGQAIFISKLDPSGNLFWAISIGGLGALGSGISIALDALGNIYSTGYFIDTMDFDPGTGVYFLNSPDPNSTAGNAFIEKLGNNLVSTLEINRISQLKVYPNPASSELTLTSSQQSINTIAVFDLMGKTVTSYGFGVSGSLNLKSKIINLKPLSPGVYFIKLQLHDGSWEVRRFVKE